MSTSNHTPVPWSQGYTLSTPQTRRWDAATITENDERERLMVFSGFSSEDAGRSRRLVAVCQRVEDARLIASAPELLAALKETLWAHEVGIHMAGIGLDKAKAAIAKATGSTS